MSEPVTENVAVAAIDLEGVIVVVNPKESYAWGRTGENGRMYENRHLESQENNLSIPGRATIAHLCARGGHNGVR